MSAEIKKEFGVEPKLIVGEKGGEFEVIVDGKTVFSKAGTNRFPNPGEVTAAIKKR